MRIKMCEDMQKKFNELYDNENKEVIVLDQYNSFYYTGVKYIVENNSIQQKFSKTKKI